jgi:hypothetical protein
MKLIAPWSHTKWITTSSGLFLISSGYAFSNNLYLESLILASTSIVSMNYWRKATYSWRRTLDLIHAKLSTMIFLYKGFAYVHYNNIHYIITGYTGLLGIAYLYHMSYKTHQEKYPYWYRYHIGFHIVLMIEQFVVINSILAYTRNKK